MKIRTEALANNRTVDSDDKTVRIQINAKTPAFLTILVIIGLVVGIVIFRIKLVKGKGIIAENRTH